MGSITPFQFQEMQRRLAPKIRQPAAPDDAVTAELPLHSEFSAWCARQQPPVPAVHTNPSKKSRATPGAPDYVVVYRGKVHLIELKDDEGEVSPAQAAWIRMANDQGVKTHICRSMREILEALNT